MSTNERPVKIVALVGSLRKKSFNRMIFENYRSLAGESAEFVEGEIRGIPLYDEDLREQGIPESVQKLGEQIRSADGVVIFSPEYNYSVPAPLKNALDWVSRLKDQPFTAKPVALVSASMGRLGGARMQYHLRQIGVFMDMRILNRPEAMIAEVHKLVDGDGRLTDEGTRKFLITHCESFLTFIRQRPTL